MGSHNHRRTQQTLSGKSGELGIVLIPEMTLTRQPSQIVISPDTNCVRVNVQITFEIGNKVDVGPDTLSLVSMSHSEWSHTDDQYGHNTS